MKFWPGVGGRENSRYLIQSAIIHYGYIRPCQAEVVQHGQPGGQIFTGLGFNGGEMLEMSHYIQAANARQSSFTHHLFPGSLSCIFHGAVHSTRHHFINQG
nr:hypothetical protein HKBLJLKJ_00221 [Porcine reproductive and respiratory syndrome virus]